MTMDIIITCLLAFTIVLNVLTILQHRERAKQMAMAYEYLEARIEVMERTYFDELLRKRMSK